MKTLQILSLSLLIFCSCTSRNTENKKTENEPIKAEQSSSLEKIHQFTSKTGEPLGGLFVKKVPGQNDIFSDIYIISDGTNSKDTLYSIKGTNFKNQKGTENIRIRENNLYGYKVELKKSDYMVLIILHDDGKSISDLTIEWNDTKKIFEVMKTP